MRIRLIEDVVLKQHHLNNYSATYSWVVSAYHHESEGVAQEKYIRKWSSKCEHAATHYINGE